MLNVLRRQGVVSLLVVTLACIVLGAHALSQLIFEPGVFTFGEYYHLRLGTISPFSIPASDPLAVGGVFAYTPYHAVLFFASSILPMDTAVYLTGAIAGALVAVLFLQLLIRFGVGVDRAALAAVIVILSPAFTNLFWGAQPAGLAMACILGGTLLLLGRQALLPTIFGTSLIALALLFGPGQALAALVFCLLVVIIDRSRRTLISCVVVAACAGWLVVEGYFGAWKLAVAPFPFGVIAELGYDGGIGLFVFLSAAIGTYTLWKRRIELWPAYALLLFFGVASFVVSAFLLSYLLLILALFASAGLFRLLEAKWEVDAIKQLTLLLVACGILFTFITSATINVDDYPPASVRQAAGFIARSEPGVILTAPEYGAALQYLAGGRVYALPHDARDARDLLMMRNPAQIEGAFVQRGITYVLIDERMRTGAVWSRPEEGLLFALRDNDLFEREYVKDGVEIWRLTP